MAAAMATKTKTSPARPEPENPAHAERTRTATPTAISGHQWLTALDHHCGGTGRMGPLAGRPVSHIGFAGAAVVQYADSPTSAPGLGCAGGRAGPCGAGARVPPATAEVPSRTALPTSKAAAPGAWASGSVSGLTGTALSPGSGFPPAPGLTPLSG